MEWSRRVVVRLLLVGIWAVSLLALAFPATAQAQGGNGSFHVVQAGETLRDIAHNAGTDAGTLIALNGLPNGDVIYVGQQLVLPGGAAANDNWQNNDNPPSSSGGPNNGPSYTEQGNQSQNWQQPQGDSNAPDNNGSPRNGQAGPNQQNSDWGWVNSDANSNTAGQSWDPSAAGQGNPGQGNGYDPSQQAGNNDGPRGPYGRDPNWGGSDNNGYASDSNAGQPNRDGSNQNNNWGWVNSEDNSHNQGASYEPSPSMPKQDAVNLTGEKWIDISIGDQTLAAYQGDTAVRTFIISTGSAAYPTVTGTFYTYARYDVQDMSGGSVAEGDYYYQPNVPWVQYFYEGFSIHGAYWHNMFGTPIGHGCINMRVEEAEWLYDWTSVTGIRVVVHQ